MHDRLSFVLFAILSVAVLGLVARGAAAAETALKPVQLRCEYLVDPLGIDQTKSRLSWMLESTLRGDSQAAYQVLVASTPEMLAKDQSDLWDSGKVVSDESAHVVYEGSPLTSRTRCYWKVRIWSTLTANPSAWSLPAHWTMGLLDEKDWNARWIDSHEAAERSLAYEPLKILRATYEAVPAKPANGAGKTQNAPMAMDVTQTVADMVHNGTISVVVNNANMGGDPALDHLKRLVVEYERSGKRQTTIVAEAKTLALPGEASALYYLRRPFTAKGPVKHAMLYVTAMGLYEVHINGKRVGDHIIAPDWTDYHTRVRYQAYDVTSVLKPGANAIAGMVSNGWYAGHVGNGGLHQYGLIPALLGQLEITYADGTTEKVMTDGSWKTQRSAILASDFMLGETYDARSELVGWDQPGLQDSTWDAVSVRDEKTKLESQVASPVRETGTIKPIKLSEPAPGKWTYDLGQNMVGVVRLKVSAPAGTVITIRHAEMLNPDGTIYTTNLRGAPSVDVYTCRGGKSETWQPKFTFHGFRYVEVTGLTGQPPRDLITGIVLGSDTPRTGSFSCSDPRINQLMSNIQWGQRGNYLSVPTDCPQRDERLGWMGDAEVFVRTATCNSDVASFFTKWLVDVDDAQTDDGAFTDVSPHRGSNSGTPAWGDAGVICPWTIYLAYGDKRILEQNLPAMAKWVDWCKAHSNGLIRDDRKSRGGDYGDWLSIKASTPKDVIGTAYFAYSASLVAKSYAAVGNSQEANKYQQLFEEIKAAFNKQYVAADGRIKGNTQCCYAMALKFDLLPTELRPMAAQYLVEDIKAKDMHLSTGFVGVSYLLPTLTQSGNIDIAYNLLMQDTFPSWLFSVKQGATTIWERWDGWTPEKGFQDPGMNSFNHYSLGSCGEWLYDSVAGIRWDESQPGYKHIIIHPMPGGGLRSAKATIGCPYGAISSDWTTVNGKFELKVTIPVNTTATVCLPTKGGETITESGKAVTEAQGVKALGMKGQSGLYEVESGTYVFSVQ